MPNIFEPFFNKKKEDSDYLSLEEKTGGKGNRFSPKNL